GSMGEVGERLIHFSHRLPPPALATFPRYQGRPVLVRYFAAWASAMAASRTSSGVYPALSFLPLATKVGVELTPCLALLSTRLFSARSCFSSLTHLLNWSSVMPID